MRRMLTVEADKLGRILFEGAEVWLDGPVRGYRLIHLPIKVKQVIDASTCRPPWFERFVDLQTGGDQYSAASIEAALVRNADKRPTSTPCQSHVFTASLL